MKRTLLGLLIVLAVAVIAVTASVVDWKGLTRQVERRDPVQVAIYYGGEKSALLANPAVKRIIEDRYRITLSASKAGSIEMATTLPFDGKDCLWPSNAVAVELARLNGRPVRSDTTIFNSPIVFFAWSQVADALEAKGIVRRGNDGTLIADVSALERLIAMRARWKEDLGLNIYGRFMVFSTDPSKSNSGNIWSGLLATAMNNGETPVSDDLPALLPRVRHYFEQMGYMEASSGDIFENFLKQGVGSRPIIVGYENQLVEFLTENSDFKDLITEKIRVIYPEPTIFSSHPLIALTPTCDRLAEALTDPELQAIAWAEHGFRTGLIGVENNPSDIAFASLPETVAIVAPMPSAQVMQAIIKALE